MRKLYLIRHAKPDFKDDIKLCIGRTDIDIGEMGIDQCQKLKKFFSDKNITRIFSSPLKRAISTAKIISEDNIEIEIVPGLIEIDMGEWEGIPLKDIKKELGDEPVYGERRVDALNRMEDSINKIMNSTEGDVICVAHAGVICAFLAKLMGVEIRTSRAIKQPYGSYNCFEFNKGKFKCLEIGVIPE